MSQTNFEEILSKFNEQFQPASSLGKARLKLTTGQIRTMIEDICGTAIGDEVSLFDLLKSNGYIYHPAEENERVVFYWLIGAKDGEN